MTGPGHAEVQEVEEPVAVPGELVVDVERVGICGTDHEFFTGHMAYLHDGHASYPVRIGHEWCGTVSAVGAGVDPGWLGKRVTADTMLGCGVCRLCLSGRQHDCRARQEIGIRGGRPGALAERLAVPVRAVLELPAGLGVTAGAMVEPGANAWRAATAALEGPPGRGSVLVCGPGTIGLLTAMFARALGADVHLAGQDEASLEFARSLGFAHCSLLDDLPDHPFDAVVDATSGSEVPARAVDIVQPGGRVVLIGIAAAASLVDSRAIVFKDATVVGILSGSPGLPHAIAAYADGTVVPDPLVAATVGLDSAAAALAGQRIGGAPGAPKIHLDPRR